MSGITRKYGWIGHNSQLKKLHVDQYKKSDGEVRDDLGRFLIAKRGTKNTWHFALYPGQKEYNCDQEGYKSGKGKWHKDWQEYSQISHVEIYIKKLVNDKEICHIADMKDKYGSIVEFQHSPISLTDVKNREEFYDNMYWVIDATSCNYIHHDKDGILVKQKERWWELFTRPTFLDIGIGVAEIKKIYSSTTRDLKGYKHSYYYHCKLESYTNFITSRFVIKDGFKLLPKHNEIKENRNLSKMEFKIHPDPQHQLTMVECISATTYDDKKSLKNFGFDKDLTNSSYSFGYLILFDNKDLSDLLANYNFETKSYNKKYQICNHIFHGIQESARNTKLYPEVQNFYVNLHSSLSSSLDLITGKLEVPLSPEGVKLLQDRTAALTKMETTMMEEDQKGFEIQTKLDESKRLEEQKRIEEQRKNEEKWIMEEQKRKDEEREKRKDEEQKRKNEELEKWVHETNLRLINEEQERQIAEERKKRIHEEQEKKKRKIENR